MLDNRSICETTAVSEFIDNIDLFANDNYNYKTTNENEQSYAEQL